MYSTHDALAVRALANCSGTVASFHRKESNMKPRTVQIRVQSGARQDKLLAATHNKAAGPRLAC